jgi:hypothetical protein
LACGRPSTSSVAGPLARGRGGGSGGTVVGAGEPDLGGGRPRLLALTMISPGLRSLPLAILSSGPAVDAMMSRASPLKVRRVLA